MSAGVARRRQQLQEKALSAGPQSLSSREKKELLCDPNSLAQLHQRVWATSDKMVARQWGIP
jgi:membrane glycosyltransferase